MQVRHDASVQGSSISWEELRGMQNNWKIRQSLRSITMLGKKKKVQWKKGSRDWSCMKGEPREAAGRWMVWTRPKPGCECDIQSEGTVKQSWGGNISAHAAKRPPSWRGRRWTGCSRNESITLPMFPRPPPPPAHTHPSSHLSSALSWKRQKHVQHPTNSPVIMQQHSDLRPSPI